MTLREACAVAERLRVHPGNRKLALELAAYVAGCGERQLNRVSALKHGHTRVGKVSTEYSAWARIRNQCSNPGSPAYRKYGGRGVRVCARWRTFTNFLADMGPVPGPGYGVVRNGNRGNYGPRNCTWQKSGYGRWR